MDRVEPSIRARVPEPVAFYEGYLEYPKVEEKSYRESLAEALRLRYSGAKFDVVITSNVAALQFAMQYRDSIFPSVPIVFIGVGDRELEGQNFPNATGLTTPWGLRETIDLALRLEPDTTGIAVVAGATPWDKEQLGYTHAELLRRQDKTREIDITGPVDTQLLEKIDALPPHTIVLFQALPQFSNQPEFGTWKLLAEVTQRLPTYSPFIRLCLKGCVGGAYADSDREAVLAGELAARILLGDRPENIPIVRNRDLQVRLDWQALQRWHISPSTIPSGGVLLNRPPDFWELYRRYIWAAIFIILAQSGAIAALLWHRARRRRVEAKLRESEQRFRLLANTAPVMIWMAGTDKLCTYVNQPWLTFTGRSLDNELGNGWTDGILAEDAEHSLETYNKAFDRREPFEMEYRVRRHDGKHRWLFALGVPRFNADASFAGYVGSCIDVTERKLAEEALSSVSRKLIEAHEEERTWIARELHDDINQRIALLAVNLDVMNQQLPASAKDARLRAADIKHQVKELGNDIQALSRRLHSSKLEYLGLSAASEAFCRELSTRQGMHIDFISENVPRSLPEEISLCLFRVLQEALQNAIKHSGSEHCRVSIASEGDGIVLTVSDAGRGFNTEEALRTPGLGLTSMSERVKIIHGELHIDSQKNHGTVIRARVPVRAATPVLSAAAV